MASLLGGFQLPFQRRLTKMYTDTKSSYDFLKEPVQINEDSELLSLHRKLRIQKDRLISWGLGWSDPSQPSDIDESLSKAGLGDVVGSVMSTIKDILAEAEPLWQSSKRSSESRSQGSEKAGDSKASLISWDRTRFEDLMKDLTSSIDILYDLSRTRETARNPAGLKQANPQNPLHTKVKRSEQRREFESTRMKTPKQIDPSHLLSANDVELRAQLPSFSEAFRNDSSRQIVYMRRQTSSANPWMDGQPPPIPMLLEYAAYDSLYANTGISPPMDRFEKLFAGLQRGQDTIARSYFGALNLVGYFEDTDNAQFGLVYELPSHLGLSKNLTMPYVTTLRDLLTNRDNEPTLDTKFRLAYNLSIAVAELHSKNIVHGNLNSRNVCFFGGVTPNASDEDRISGINARRPVLISFDLFPDTTSRSSMEELASRKDLYKHELDPRLAVSTVLTEESRSLDLHGLGMLLLEIGLWSPLERILPSSTAGLSSPTSYLKQLASRCGTSYVRAAEACWHAVDDEVANKYDVDSVLDVIYETIATDLERCCTIDEDSDQEEVTRVSSPTAVSDPRDPSWHQNSLEALFNTPRPVATLDKSMSLSMPNIHGVDIQRDVAQEGEKRASIADKPQTRVMKTNIDIKADSPRLKPSEPKPRLKIFPAVKLEQQHLDQWHSTLMPRINHALRGFYRKYPESVEISLESIGETVNKTKPTILVVCTSVGKVRSILKKHFIHDTSIFGLIVCRGMVFRSRKNNTKRSIADSEADLPKALNPDYQVRPLNGASIGAYVEGQHLAPVSFGGVIQVNDKCYGMSVHHMLDNEDEQELSNNAQLPLRASGRQNGGGFHIPTPHAFDDHEDEGEGYDVSEYGSDTYSETSSDAGSYMDDEDETFKPTEPGDIEGIPEGCGKGYAVTQPALDDVDEDFFPSDEDAVEDHLDTFRLGEIYASSGIRRKHQDGITHEIDWALFEFSEERRPPGNYIKGGEKHCQIHSRYPVEIAPWSSLHGLEVHCNGRSTGLQTGRILPGMTVVKIFGRQTPSQSYQVSGKLGIPGDSGAWIIDNVDGRACGHVLAWSSRKQVAYICPMEVLLTDISETLNATVALPDTMVAMDHNIPQINAKIREPQPIGLQVSDGRDVPRSLASKITPLEDLKRLANVPYSVPEDDLASAMSSMHVSHELVSPN